MGQDAAFALLFHVFIASTQAPQPQECPEIRGREDSSSYQSQMQQKKDVFELLEKHNIGNNFKKK